MRTTALLLWTPRGDAQLHGDLLGSSERGEKSSRPAATGATSPRSPRSSVAWPGSTSCRERGITRWRHAPPQLTPSQRGHGLRVGHRAPRRSLAPTVGSEALRCTRAHRQRCLGSRLCADRPPAYLVKAGRSSGRGTTSWRCRRTSGRGWACSSRSSTPLPSPACRSPRFIRSALNAKRQGIDKDPKSTPRTRRAAASRCSTSGADAREDGAPEARGQLRGALRERGLLGRREEAARDAPDGDARAEFAILDETDSGLDIDALRIVAEGVNAQLNPNSASC